MTVQQQTFVQSVVPGRIPVPTTITNVFATLQGTDPTASTRIYVVCAQRDSTDPLWTHSHQVGNITDVTLTVPNPVNTQFGVRAVNSAGDRSPVSYAGPASS
jgi:hypothetical protein